MFLDIRELVGEVTEYDKKVALDREETEKLAEKCKCLRQWNRRKVDLWRIQ